MKKRFSAILLAVFFAAIIFQGCKAKEPCPAYASHQIETGSNDSVAI